MVHLVKIYNRCLVGSFGIDCAAPVPAGGDSNTKI